eukprot:TRINITY_DN65862_c6_g2_i1.p1 TRINITY_DN65862_c6_g2~~TRINITY_DN65862_c6_g2_i1.p1  ORF type:complete len:1048 (-),score=628.07 TRINITY_DN65862_c6_g2_i1:58-3024(-)
MEGVVFLDRQDRQMVLLRSTNKVIHLSQCGISKNKRFTFYDQVHTTGMDIKQALNASAVLTLGKDMTFRDYSQGAYRMRGIGKGQTIHLYIIPEVLKLIQKEAKVMRDTAPDPKALSDNIQSHVAAWLTVNSMRSEKLQFMQLCVQNMANVWRKRAFWSLFDESVAAVARGEGESPSSRRHWRFQELSGQEQTEWLRKCVGVFREHIDFVVQSDVTDSVSFLDTLVEQAKEQQEFIAAATAASSDEHKAVDVEQRRARDGAADVQLVQKLASGADSAGSNQSLTTQRALNAEMVQEAEQEAERQKEVQQEQQVQVRFSREDEQQIPWPVSQLASTNLRDADGAGAGAAEEQKKQEEQPAYWMRNVRERHAFYPFSQFSLRGTGKSDLQMPLHVALSHNYFRPEWAAMGQRRLKNISLILEWIPTSTKKQEADDSTSATTPATTTTAAAELSERQESALRKAFDMFDFDGTERISLRELSRVMVAVGENMDDKELRNVLAGLNKSDTDELTYDEFRQMMLQRAAETHKIGADGSRRYVALSLAEAESLRRLIHMNHPIVTNKRQPVGLALRTPDGSLLDASPTYVAASRTQQRLALQCFRFINCEFFYTDAEMSLLLRALSSNKELRRRAFFENVLLCRRRDRRRWNDTPLTSLFTLPDEYRLLALRAMVSRIRRAIERKGMGLHDAFNTFDSIGDSMLSETELHYALDWLDLGLNSDDIGELVRHADKNNDGLVDVHEFVALFRDPDQADTVEQQLQQQQEDEQKSAAAAAAADSEEMPPLQEQEQPMERQPSVTKFERLVLPAEYMERYKREEEERKQRLDRQEEAERLERERREEERRAEKEEAERKAREWRERQAVMRLLRQESALVQQDWNCPMCTMLNEATRAKCQMCDTARPKQESAGAGAADDVDGDVLGDGDEDSAEPPFWTCTTCTFDNPRENATCSMCNTKKPKREARVVKLELWECPACTKMNAINRRYCDVCDTKQ